VYRARDTRLEREARLLAALNHPHIATLYGFEESGGTPALVMELVEGATLAARLERGPLPLEEVLELTRQIAEALEAAHEKGILHRDLKPAAGGASVGGEGADGRPAVDGDGRSSRCGGGGTRGR
jgi:serine/threonine protein kinase